MKTKFFKKLSFVLVVAMVLSLFVPAAGVFAAAKPSLNSKNKYLHLSGNPGPNEYNFNIKNKKKGWSYEWESDNEAIAEVNVKNGVTVAKAVGKTKVTVYITDKNGEEVQTLSATVTVRDNIKEVSISNPVEKLAVGEAHDYNRSYVTEANSTKKTSSITRWTVSPDTATIDDKGVFVATEGGEYTVTALSFQSKAKYNDWKKDAEKYATNVLDTDETKVVVAGSMVEAKQVDLRTLTVTFDSKVDKSDLDKNLKVSYLAGTTKVTHQIKEIKIDEDSKVATVELYGELVKDTVYVVDYVGMEAVQFKSAAVKHTDVERVEILTKVVQVGEPEEIEIALYDVNGVNIANTDLLNRVELKTSSNQTYLSGKNLSMYKVGDTTTITATYHTYEYDLTTGQEKGVVTVEGLVTCVEKKTDLAGLLNAYTVVKKDEFDKKSANFGDVKHTIAAGDTGLYLAVELKGKKANGWEDNYTNNIESDEGFKYVSSNSDILIVGEADAYIYPVKEGQAAIVVSYNDTVVGSALVTVVGSRRVTSVTLDTTNFTLSNHVNVEDFKYIGIQIKDQLGDDYDMGSVDISIKANGNVDDKGLSKGYNSSENRFEFAGVDIPEKNYTYTVTVKDKANGWAETNRFLSVNVAKASSDTVYRYAIEADKAEYDMNVVSWDNSEDVILSLFGYASNGVRNLRVDLADPNYTMTIQSPYGGPKFGNVTGSGITVIPVSDSNAKLSLVTVEKDDKITSKDVYKKLAAGTYILEAKDADDKPINATYFTVKDSQAAPTLKLNKLYTDKVDVLSAINDCFDFNLNGTDLQVEALEAVDCSGNTGKSVLVKTVFVYQEVGGAYVRHEVKVNTVIHYAQ